MRTAKVLRAENLSRPEFSARSPGSREVSSSMRRSRRPSQDAMASHTHGEDSSRPCVRAAFPPVYPPLALLEKRGELRHAAPWLWGVPLPGPASRALAGSLSQALRISEGKSAESGISHLSPGRQAPHALTHASSDLTCSAYGIQQSVPDAVMSLVAGLPSSFTSAAVPKLSRKPIVCRASMPSSHRISCCSD